MLFQIIVFCALTSSAFAGYAIPSYSDYSGASLKSAYSAPSSGYALPSYSDYSGSSSKSTYSAPSAYAGKEATSYAIVTTKSASAPVAYEAPSYEKAYSYSAPAASSGYGGESYGKAAEVDYYVSKNLAQ